MKTAVGFYKGELYISENGNVNSFDVIRPVSAELLEQLHDLDYWKENYRYWWIDAVRAGKTDESLEEFFQSLMDEEDNGCEEFIGKDSSDCDVFDYDDKLRKKCDAYIEKLTGKAVGTWESGGFYSPMKRETGPDGEYKATYQRFDKVLDKKLAQKYYELHNL